MCGRLLLAIEVLALTTDRIGARSSIFDHTGFALPRQQANARANMQVSNLNDVGQVFDSAMRAK